MIALLFGAVLLAGLHAAIPNHWMPLVILNRSERWSRRETLTITAASGFAHTASTILIGLLVGFAGLNLSKSFELYSSRIAPTILILLGLAYIAMQLMGKGGHSHSHLPGLAEDHDHEHGRDSHGHDHGNDHDHPHPHEHSHSREHDHDHDHPHPHEHSHSREHDHDHDHPHPHEHSHDHEHDHDHDHPHPHEHSLDQEHDHDHDHPHPHEHSHDHEHDHDHNRVVKQSDEQAGSHRTKGALIGSLLVAMFFSPCLEIEAYYLTAAAYGWAGILMVSLIYLVLTVAGMLLLVELGMRGVKAINFHFLEHNEKLASGAALVLVGIGAFFIKF
jgi:hypothetical protein